MTHRQLQHITRTHQDKHGDSLNLTKTWKMKASPPIWTSRIYVQKNPQQNQKLTATKNTQKGSPKMRLLLWKSYLKPLQPLCLGKIKLGRQREREEMRGLMQRGGKMNNEGWLYSDNRTAFMSKNSSLCYMTSVLQSSPLFSPPWFSLLNLGLYSHQGKENCCSNVTSYLNY